MYIKCNILFHNLVPSVSHISLAEGKKMKDPGNEVRVSLVWRRGAFGQFHLLFP